MKEVRYNMNNSKYGYIDIFKFIFSICIIAIHTGLLYDTNPTINWYLTHMILRLAVPFFFITSGFFYGRKLLKSKSKIDDTTKSYIKRLLYPMIFWLLISLPFTILNTYDGNIISTFLHIIQKILFYPWGALWYVLALIIAVMILSKFYKNDKFYFPLLIGFLLYTFALIANSYYFVIIDRLLIKKIVDLYIKIFISSRNGIFVGIFYVSLGVILSKLQKEKKLLTKKENIIGLIITYFAYIIEIYIVNHKPILDDSSLFIFLPIFIFLLVSFLIQLNNNKEYKNLRDYSIGFYLMHYPIINIIRIFIPGLNGYKCFLLVLFFSMIICSILFKIKSKFIKKIMLL